MWCLYGFIKNLPETGEMIHGFVEYSLVSYWDELKKVNSLILPIITQVCECITLNVKGFESFWGQLQGL